MVINELFNSGGYVYKLKSIDDINGYKKHTYTFTTRDNIDYTVDLYIKGHLSRIDFKIDDVYNRSNKYDFINILNTLRLIIDRHPSIDILYVESIGKLRTFYESVLRYLNFRIINNGLKIIAYRL
jgi:hypothetical protein